MSKRGNQTAGKFWARNGLIGDLSARYNILVAEWLNDQLCMPGSWVRFSDQDLGERQRCWDTGLIDVNKIEKIGI